MQLKEVTDLFGVDISSLQSITDEALLFSQIDFLIVRAYGSDHTGTGDSKTALFADAAERNNCPVGTYFFGTPYVDALLNTDAEIIAHAEAQCQQYIDKLYSVFGTGNTGDITPFLDVESYQDKYNQPNHTATNVLNYPQESGMTGTQLLVWIKAFRDKFWAVTRRRLGLYSNRYFLTTTDVSTETGLKEGMGMTTVQLNELSNMPLWLAEYDEYYGGSVANDQPADLAGWNKYVAWQYTVGADASSFGVSHGTNQIDKNRCKDIDWLLIPDPNPSWTVTDNHDGTITVALTHPTHIDYIGTSVYQDTVWKRWVTTTGTTSTISGLSIGQTYDFQLASEDEYHDLGWSDIKTVTITEADSDGDGIPDSTDAYPDDPTNTPPQPDSDGDGIPDAQDAYPDDPTNTPPEAPPETPTEGGNFMPTVAMGTTIKKVAGVAIAGLTSISGLDLSADTIDTTTLSSEGGYREFTSSFRDAGEVGISGYFDYTSHSPILDDFEAGSTGAYVITFPNGSTWTFDAVVVGFVTGAELEDLISFEGTLKVSGAPTLTAPTP